MKVAAVILTLLGFGSSRKCKATPAIPMKFTILHTNDIHSHLDQFNAYGTDCNTQAIIDNKCFGGVARIKQVVDQFRASSDNIIVLDAGDQFQGTLFFNLYGGLISAELMNLIGYDAMTIGNHEFDSGLEKLAEFIEITKFPIISSNIGVEGSPLENLVQPYIVLDKYKLGIIGYITPTTANIVGMNIVDGLTFSDPIVTVQKAVDELKAKGVNRIICVSHNGYVEDQKLGKSTTGINLIVGGHSHDLLSNDPNLGARGLYPTAVKNLEDKPTYIVQAHRFGDYLGHIDLEYDENDELISIQGTPILLDQNIEPDATLFAQVAELKKGFETFQNDILTQSTSEFGSNSACKRKECALGNIISGCMISEQADRNIHADISFFNGGGIRASIGKGPVSFADVMTILPFGDAIVALDFSGQQILDILEAVAAGKQKDGSKIISPPQWSGVQVTIDKTKPEFQRVVEILIGGVKLDISAIYSVLTVEYIATGGDNIMPQVPVILGDLLAETFASCLRKKPEIAPILLDYMKFIE